MGNMTYIPINEPKICNEWHLKIHYMHGDGDVYTDEIFHFSHEADIKFVLFLLEKYEKSWYYLSSWRTPEHKKNEIKLDIVTEIKKYLLENELPSVFEDPYEENEILNIYFNVMDEYIQTDSTSNYTHDADITNYSVIYFDADGKKYSCMMTK